MESKGTLNYRLYQLDKAFKEKSNFNNYVKEAQNFYNGDQYPNENYKNMLRVTMNLCSFSSNLKAAKIVGTPRYIRFVSDSDDVDCTALQRFDEYNISKLNEKTEDFQATLDSLNNGTAITFYRWDEDDTSYKGIYKGGLVIEQLDVTRFAVANPRIDDIQNQKWVMYWKDEEVMALKELVERYDEKERERVQESIVPDNFDDENGDKENINHGLATLYTRYFKISGEVYFMCSTKDVDLFEYPHALSPIANKALDKQVRKIIDDYKKKQKEGVDEFTYEKIVDYDIDYEDVMIQFHDNKKLDDKEYKNIKEKFSLYPFADLKLFKINNSFYGRSDIKSLIPTQKGINFALSMMLKCIENNAYNKIFAKDGALQGQEITNDPGQVIFDYSRMTNGWGIKFAESQPMPNGVIDFIDKFIGMARVFGGFNDVMDGSVSNQDISGYAIQQMIKQANSSIEQQQQIFWKYCKDKAAIRLTFYKFYVDEAKYTYELPDYEVDKEEDSRKRLEKRQKQLAEEGKSLEVGNVDVSVPTKKIRVETFAKEKIYGANFDINIDVMQGLVDSKLAESQMWDTLILNGGIQNMDPEMLEMYIQVNPTVSEHTKHALKAIIEKQKRGENYQLKQQLSQALEYLQKLMSYAKELEAQNGYKTNYIDNLTKEFVNKISVANKTINAQNQALSQRNKNAVSEGEAKSLNSQGISGSSIDNTNSNSP